MDDARRVGEAPYRLRDASVSTGPRAGRMPDPQHRAISLVLSVVPALALLWFVRRIDRARPVPRPALYATMALGAAMCVPAALVEFALHRALGDASLVGGRFVDAFLVAAFTEESLKLLVVLAYPFRRARFEEVLDGVVYTVAASLGFGLLENVAFSVDDVGTAVARGLTTVPMHAVASGVMGYFVGRAYFTHASGRYPVAMAGLFFAVLIHGLYDWAVFHRDAHWLAESVAVLVASTLFLAALVRHALRMDDAMLGRQSMAVALDSAWPSEITTTLVPPEVRPSSETTAGPR